MNSSSSSSSTVIVVGWRRFDLAAAAAERCRHVDVDEAAAAAELAGTDPAVPRAEKDEDGSKDDDEEIGNIGIEAAECAG